jgi:uncharacterized Zn finger protein
VLGPSTGGSRTTCPRCNAQMVEMVRTEPSRNEPGLIWYECPSCGCVRSVPTGPNSSEGVKESINRRARPTNLFQ